MGLFSSLTNKKVMLIRSPADLDSFKREYGVEDVKKIF